MQEYLPTTSTVLALLIVSGTLTPIATAFAQDQAESTAKAFLTSLIEKKQAPGVQYVMVDAENVIYKFNGGYADFLQRIPVTDSTTFNAYSVTKTFTAAAIVKLAIEGKIDLDKPIATFLDDYPYRKSPTVRQTLQHTGGFPNPNPMAWIHLADEHDNFDELEFVRTVTHKNPKLDSEPGEKFAYSNVGYLLLGEVIRKVSGQPYDQYVAKEIINPLSLRDDQSLAFTIEHPQNHAHGYIRKWYWLNFVLGWFIDRDTFLAGSASGWIEFRNFLVNGKAYGGLTGNAAGFARYLQAMLRQEAPFTRAMLDLMWQPGVTRTGRQTPAGLAWVRGSLNNEPYYAHSGGGGGYYCEIRIYPAAKRASVIMTNNTAISGQHYLDDIDPAFLGQDKRL